MAERGLSGLTIDLPREGCKMRRLYLLCSTAYVASSFWITASARASLAYFTWNAVERGGGRQIVRAVYRSPDPAAIAYSNREHRLATTAGPHTFFRITLDLSSSSFSKAEPGCESSSFSPIGDEGRECNSHTISNTQYYGNTIVRLQRG
jgi:hypothetical protein